MTFVSALKIMRTIGRMRATHWAGILILGLAACDQQGVEDLQEFASPLRVRLMTAQQYTNTVADVFGADIAASVVAPIPPMNRTDGLLASGASAVGLTSDQLQQIQQTAAAIAKKVVDESHRDFLFPCRPESIELTDADCAQRFLSEVGLLLHRRPLSQEKLKSLVVLAGDVTEQTKNFYDGVAIALEAILISPEALFIIDVAEADPRRANGRRRLDGYSLASRLSFFLWNSVPDRALLEAAQSGALYTEQGLDETVARMLSSHRIERGVRAFFDDMLHLDEFDSLAKDATVFPMVTGATLADAREQVLRTAVDHLLHKNLDYRDLYTTRDTFVSMDLGPIYNVAVTDEWRPHRFSESSQRRGILTQMGFLAAHSHPVRSSPTLRGRALRELFLCQKVPDAPPNVDFSTIEDAGDVATARERLQVHNTNPSCAGCHLLTDPVGLSLENFDAAGRYRDDHNGVVLDIAGELDGVLYDDVVGLTLALRNHRKLPHCLVRRLYSYGTGGPLELRYDRAIVKTLEETFAAEQYRLPALMSAIAKSPAFYRVRQVSESEQSLAYAHPGHEQATNTH